MATTYTACISRELSRFQGKSNGLECGRIFALVEGDKVVEYSSMEKQAEIFYFMSVDLETSAAETLENMIGENQVVSADCFSQAEIDYLKGRGSVSAVGSSLDTTKIKDENGDVILT